MAAVAVRVPSFETPAPPTAARSPQDEAPQGEIVLGFIIQRLLQALVVMLAISILVFVGVYAIGNPCPCWS